VLVASFARRWMVPFTLRSIKTPSFVFLSCPCLAAAFIVRRISHSPIILRHSDPLALRREIFLLVVSFIRHSVRTSRGLALPSISCFHQASSSHLVRPRATIRIYRLRPDTSKRVFRVSSLSEQGLARTSHPSHFPFLF
jgi:hypothetical protein